MSPRRKPEPATLATVRRHALSLPGVEEGTSYGTPAFRVSGKLFARMHQTEDAVIIRMDRDMREALMRRDPETFFITDHYLAHPWVLVRLATVDHDALGGLLEQAWRRFAAQRLLDEHDGPQS
jgi:hypothetical protein